jgi:hypothetical protein
VLLDGVRAEKTSRVIGRGSDAADSLSGLREIKLLHSDESFENVIQYSFLRRN